MPSEPNVFEDSPEVLQEFVPHFDWVVCVSAPDGTPVAVGPGLDRLIGSDVGPSRQDALRKLIHPEDAPDLRRLMSDPDRAPYETHYRIVRPDGEVRWVRQRGFLVPGDADPRQVVGIIEDVTEQRLDRERLEETSRLLSRTFLSLDEAVLIISGGDAERTIREANRAAERVFGYSQEELVGSTTEMLHVDRESFERFGRESTRALERAGGFQSTYPLKRKDGSVFEAEQRVSLLHPDQGIAGGAVSVVRDVSEQARAEARIRQSEKQFRLIAEGIDAVFWILTLPGVSREYVSPAYEEIWGRSREDLYDDSWAWLDSVLPSDRERVEEEFTTDPGEFDVEYRIVRPDGEIRWIWDRAFPLEEDGAEIRRIVGVAEDITERKVAEERFGLLSQEIDDLIYVLRADGTVRFASPSVSRVLGYERREFEGREVFDFVHPEDREVVRDSIRRVAGDPETTSEDQYRMIRADGSTLDVEAVVQNRLDHLALGGMIVTARDITRRLELEEQLRQSQKMEAIGRLAGGVAHDFNNLLTVIRSQADLLLLDLDDEEAVRELEVIQNSADRAAKLTSQLLAFGREQVLRPRTVDVGAVVRGMGDLLDRVIGEHISLLYDLPDDIQPVRLDSAQLEQAVLNLALNARDAMPSGGTLSFSTYVEEDGDRVVLEISDTGEGMDEETQTRIFEPFFTTKGPASGTGLGLSMVYGFVAQSGGTVDVDSSLGGGATFRLFFPPARDEGTDLPVAGRRPGRERAAPQVSGRILVVEDDPAVRRVTIRILEREGMDVEAVDTSEEALEKLAADREIGLVLTDLVLPGSSGRDLIDRLGMERPDIAVVAMSGYAPGSPGRRGDLPEEIVFLQKPFTPEQLIEAVGRVAMAPRDAASDS